MSLSSVKNACLKRIGLKVHRQFLGRSSSSGTFSSASGRRFSPSGVELPEEPINCCMSGCANCVWIQYAEKLMAIFRDGDEERAREIVLSKVQDPNMKAYLELELKFLERKNKGSSGGTHCR